MSISCAIVGGDCYNEFVDDSVCVDLTRAGECSLSPEWMGRYCKKACDACDGLPIGESTTRYSVFSKNFGVETVVKQGDQLYAKCQG